MQSTARNGGIDFVKGVLVLAMVGYHALNYFVEGRVLAYSYVGYVGPAFIFFAGVVSGAMYLEKFGRDKGAVSLRLLVRGLKLIALFFAVNILIHMMVKENYTGERLGIGLILRNAGDILSRGRPRLMAFEILVPIAYVLLISVPLLYLARYRHIMYVLVVAAVCFLPAHMRNSYNLVYGLFGVAGCCTGLVCVELKPLSQSALARIAAAATLGLYLLILIPARINVLGILALLYLYVNVVTAGSYLLGSSLNPGRRFTRIFLLLGRYSLYLYLAQIFIMQILYRFGVTRETFAPVRILAVVLAVSFLITVLAFLTDRVRGRFSIADRIYRFVFA